MPGRDEVMLQENFHFPSNNGGEVKGISDSGIETFAGNSIKGLGREIIQNSLDANAEFEEPAIVEFSLFTLNFSSLPGGNSLKEAFSYAKRYWSKQNSKKAQNFFEYALSQSESDIEVLRISDFNTTGLTGSRGEYNTPWVDLTKSSGVSDKAKGGSMGSFGIGKFATFANSSLRTIFFNTIDVNGEKAFQGISRLTSFVNEDGETTQGMGYLGRMKTYPEYENISLDPSFFRLNDQTGTDIFIPGFKNLENKWEEEIVSAVLDGYLYAIYSGALIVKVGNLEINSDSLPGIVEEYKDSFTEGAYFYFQVLTSPKTKYFKMSYRNDGDVKIWILLEENMNNKVAMIRGAGMKIKDMPFSNSLISGAAVMVIEGQKIQDVLIPLENPTHTEWEPKRSEKPPYARNYIKGINELLKNKLVELSGLDDLDEIDSDVGEYLPIITSEEKDKTEDETVSDKVKAVFKKEIIKKKEKIFPNDNEIISPIETTEYQSFDFEEKEQGESISRTGHNHSEQPIEHPENKKDHTAGEGYGNAPLQMSSIKYPIFISDVRTLVQMKDEGRYILLFTPERDTPTSEIEISLVGESGKEKVNILTATTIPPVPLSVIGNTIKGLPLSAGDQTKIIIQINFEDYVAMEVSVRGI